MTQRELGNATTRTKIGKSFGCPSESCEVKPWTSLFGAAEDSMQRAVRGWLPHFMCNTCFNLHAISPRHYTGLSRLHTVELSRLVLAPLDDAAAFPGFLYPNKLTQNES